MGNRIDNELLQRIAKGSASALEHQAFNDLLSTLDPSEYEEVLSDFEKLIAQVTDEKEISPLLWEKIKLKVEAHEKLVKVKHKKTFSWISAAAAVLIFSVGIGSYVYYTAGHIPPVTKLNPESTLYANDIEPGSNKAILTLADGRKIDLRDDKNGLIIQPDKLTYSDGTEIGTKLSPTKGGGKTAKLNTISIPHGGQYQVRLADGTQVWLNAASSLTYPTNLNELQERKVTLSGEAYFEVAKDENHPFIVETAFQELRVLGTHFNVYAYEEEQVTKTTLLEGAVRVSPITPNKEQVSVEPSILLHPNQQSILIAGSPKFQVGEVDAGEAIAWQRGYFMFSNEPLENVMNKIARWYDVNVVFNDDSLRKEVIYGTVSRSEKVSGILKKLELTGELWFEIEDATIYVFKKN